MKLVLEFRNYLECLESSMIFTTLFDPSLCIMKVSHINQKEHLESFDELETHNYSKVHPVIDFN